VSPALSVPLIWSDWGALESAFTVFPLRVAVVPGIPNARLLWLSTSAATAQAPKKIIRTVTRTSTSENTSGTGIRFVLVNLLTLF